MSESLVQAALAISGMLFSSLWEGAIVVAAVWAFTRAFPKIGASTRYAIWLCALVMLVVAPVCTMELSGRHAAQRAPAPFSAVTAADSNVAAGTPAIAAAQSIEHTEASPAKHIDIPLDLSWAIAALWFATAGTGLVILLINLRRLAALRHSAQILRTAFGYTVLASGHTHVPLAIGFVHPAVVLPSSLNEELPAQAIDAIVMHEVAHLRRYDVWTNALARVLQALLVLNPLAWVVLARLSVEREIACDDWVVSRLDAGEVFANALAKMACRPAFASIAAPSAIGSKHTIVERIERLLDKRPRRLRLSAIALTGILLLLTLFVTTVPTISPVLAFAPQGCADHPALMEGINNDMRPTGRWVPLKYDASKAKNAQNTVMDVTIDAKGNLNSVAVVSTPHKRDGEAAKRFFEMGHYKPAVVNCKAVTSTVRIAGLIDIAPPAPISIVRADYPNGWSAAHPGACRVPDLTHGGVPDVRLVNNKTLTASVLVRVDSSGKVADARLTQSSGNATYDNATLAAARAGTYPLGDGFKPVRPRGATLSWNAAHGYSLYSKCTPLPGEYTWTTTFPPASS